MTASVLKHSQTHERFKRTLKKRRQHFRSNRFWCQHSLRLPDTPAPITEAVDSRQFSFFIHHCLPVSLMLGKWRLPKNLRMFCVVLLKSAFLLNLSCVWNFLWWWWFYCCCCCFIVVVFESDMSTSSNAKLNVGDLGVSGEMIVNSKCKP